VAVFVAGFLAREKAGMILLLFKGHAGVAAAGGAE